MSQGKDMLRVSVHDGKYTVVQDSCGKLFTLRYDALWRDCDGDKLIYCLASEVEELRCEVNNLKAIMAGEGGTQKVDINERY